MAERYIPIARDLQGNVETSGPHRKEAFTIVEGVKVTHPYQFVEQASQGDYFPTEIMDGYKVGKELTDNMPSHWIEVVKEADVLKQQKGADFPVNLLHGVLRVSNNSEKAKELGVVYPKNKDGWPSFDKAKVVEAVDAVIANPDLRKELLQQLAVQVPDESGSDQAEHLPVIFLLEKLGIKSGVMLDIGSGLGNIVNQWAREVKLHVVASERQFDAAHYPRFWKNRPNLSFMNADATQLPVKDSSVKVAMMENVVQHMTEDSLVKALPEVMRVLQPEGLLFVGPSTVDDWNNWIVLRKERNEETSEYVFNRYTISDLEDTVKK
jgi:SAM-dependent methyltransferase